ncbi:MAG: hypothetical protein ACLFR1_14890 [Spirochaetia bacterium]
MLRVFIDSQISTELSRVLDNGLTCHLQYEIHSYRSIDGILAFLGDHRIARESVRVNGNYNRFTERFEVTSQGAALYATQWYHYFLSSLFSYEIHETAPGTDYILVRAILYVVSPVPPFNIVSFLYPMDVYNTNWQRVDISHRLRGSE